MKETDEEVEQHCRTTKLCDFHALLSLKAKRLSYRSLTKKRLSLIQETAFCLDRLISEAFFTALKAQ
jgi:hypothetical protein